MPGSAWIKKVTGCRNKKKDTTLRSKLKNKCADFRWEKNL